ncbi:MAG: hypothetical protein ABR553_00275 [Gammaproteobacteria bacterium]
MKAYPPEVPVRLHMGCGESLRSQLLLGIPRPLPRDPAGGVRRAAPGAKRPRDRQRG